jgi:23S rRNA (guanosine2251-2'-O)-methyltransferase
VSNEHHKKTNSIWVYGKHAVEAILKNPERKLIRILATSEHISWLEKKTSLKIQIATAQQLNQHIGNDVVHQGVAVLTEPAIRYLEDILEKAQNSKKMAIAILDQVTDPQNIGSILRAAAAFQIEALLVPQTGSPDLTSASIKVSAGASEIVPYIKVSNLARTLSQLKEAGFWVIGFAEEGQASLQKYTFDEKIVLVLGAEGSGMRRLTREACDILLKIPTRDSFSTLNVAQAASVVFYEYFRQQNV